MKTSEILQRVTLILILGILGYMAPLWVLVVFVAVAVFFVPAFVEGAIIVMTIEYIGRDFASMGYVGWVLVAWILMCEVVRTRFRMNGNKK